RCGVDRHERVLIAKRAEESLLERESRLLLLDEGPQLIDLHVIGTVDDTRRGAVLTLASTPPEGDLGHARGPGWRRRRNAGQTLALGHRLHPRLHADVWRAELGLRLPDLRRAALHSPGRHRAVSHRVVRRIGALGRARRPRGPHPPPLLPKPTRQTSAGRDAGRDSRNVGAAAPPLRAAARTDATAALLPRPARPHCGD